MTEERKFPRNRRNSWTNIDTSNENQKNSFHQRRHLFFESFFDYFSRSSFENRWPNLLLAFSLVICFTRGTNMILIITETKDRFQINNWVIKLEFRWQLFNRFLHEKMVLKFLWRRPQNEELFFVSEMWGIQVVMENTRARHPLYPWQQNDQCQEEGERLRCYSLLCCPLSWQECHLFYVLVEVVKERFTRKERSSDFLKNE